MRLWTCINDANDKTGNGLHGTPTNVSWVASTIGNAASFNGTTSKIDIANPGDIFDGKTLTVAAWIYRDGTSGTAYPRIIDRVYNGQFSCYVREASNCMGMAIKGVGGTADLTIVSPENSTPVNTVLHCVWCYNGTQVLTYINGVLAATTAANYGVLAASVSAIRVGDRADGTNRKFKGWINDLRVWGRVLPIEEIAAIYNFGRGTDEMEPWRRDDSGLFLRRAA